MNNILFWILALLLIPACADNGRTAAPASKAGGASKASKAGKASKVDVSREAGKQAVTGQASAEGVTSLEFELSNGEVECVAGSVAPGEVSLSWTIDRQKGGIIKSGDPKDLEITVEQNGDQLVVQDHWRGKKFANRPTISLVITAHPETLISGSLGNGSITLENHRIADLSLGNGQVEANGELMGNGGISLGNGEIGGSLLIAKGDHTISMGNGAVSLTLLEGSSLKLNSAVGIGYITIGGIESERDWGFLGGSVNAVIGAGASTLAISAGNGQIDLDVEKQSTD